MNAKDKLKSVKTIENQFNLSSEDDVLKLMKIYQDVISVCTKYEWVEKIPPYSIMPMLCVINIKNRK